MTKKTTAPPAGMTTTTKTATTTVASDAGTRTITSESASRSFSVDLSTLDTEKRTVELAASSEYPVLRHFGFEILDHGEESVDLSRMNAGAPVLDMHDHYRRIGVVEHAWLDADRVLRVRVRYSRNAYADEVWRDVVDGICVNVSIGYLVYEMRLESEVDGLETYRATRWMPYEVSSVSVPADPTVGVGRSENFNQHQPVTIRSIEPMGPEDDNTNAAATNATRSQGAQPADPVQDARRAERERISEIRTIGERMGYAQLAEQHTNADTTVDAFRKLVMDQMSATPTPTPDNVSGARNMNGTPNFAKPGADTRGLGISDDEMKDYSLFRALDAAATGNWDKAGFERQVSVAIADATKKESRGFYVPHAVLARAIEKKTPEKGGNLVDTMLMVEQFVDYLRTRAVLGRLGARTLGGLVGDVSIPKKVSASSFGWIDEGEDSTLSDFDVGLLDLSPKTIAGGIPMSRKMRKQGAMSIETMIVRDLVDGIAVAIDAAMLNGSGEGAEPLGLLKQAGLGAITPYQGDINWNAVVDLESEVDTDALDGNALAYLTSRKQRGIAKKSFVASGTGERLWQKGEVNDYRVEASNQFKLEDAWLFGDFSQILMAFWGVLDVKVDNSTKAASDGQIIRVFQDVDTNVRRPEAFALARKATTA